ncbi:MAG: hypothetical protein AAGK02_00195 [Pseudomonadota bacterium]
MERAEAVARYESAMVDADIEGLARDPEAEALVAEWRAANVSIEDQIARLKDRYRERRLRAAE